jgi:hypothetical protein
MHLCYDCGDKIDSLTYSKECMKLPSKKEGLPVMSKLEQLAKDTFNDKIQEQPAPAMLNHNSRVIADIYCRVSTDQQEDNTSLDEQEAAGRQYCKEHGLSIHRLSV